MKYLFDRIFTSPRRRLSPLALLGLVLALTCSQGAVARVIADLYRVGVEIDAQSPAELKRAGGEALAELFVRVSGHASVLDSDTVRNAVREANRYTKQFSYERTVDSEGEEQLRVVFEFEPSLVEDALRRAGQPLWSANRPLVLLWIGVEDNGVRRFATQEKDPELVRAIRANARRRGLAVQLPAMDLEDLVAASPEDIWRQNFSRLEQAGERYNPDAVLVGRATHLSSGGYLGRWYFLVDGRRIALDGEADDIASYIASGLDQVAETLASEYAITPVQVAGGEGILLRLTEVRNFVDYARAVQYLEGVVAVHHANVVSLQDDELILRLIADGEPAQLKQVFALDKKLQPAGASVYTGPYPITLSYRWPSTGEPLPQLARPAADTAMPMEEEDSEDVEMLPDADLE